MTLETEIMHGVLAGEALRLYGVNTAWKVLGTCRPEEEEESAGAGGAARDFECGAGRALASGVADGELALAAAREVFERCGRAAGVAKVQQAMGTCCYARAAFLLDAESAREWYELANTHLIAALQSLQSLHGEADVDVAACAIDLGISFGNRRRTLESRSGRRAERCRELARAWYLKGLLIRCAVLGGDHPLSRRALFGFQAHADP